ncbi:MAG: DsbA family protein, partial [bacterium]
TGGEAVHDAMFRSYFVDTENISDPEVLVRTAEGAGLSGEGAREVIESRSFKAAVDADWNRSHQAGVTGVPTFVAGGYGLVGAQPYEMLEQLVMEAGKETEA